MLCYTAYFLVCLGKNFFLSISFHLYKSYSNYINKLYIHHALNFTKVIWSTFNRNQNNLNIVVKIAAIVPSVVAKIKNNYTF